MGVVYWFLRVFDLVYCIAFCVIVDIMECISCRVSVYDTIHWVLMSLSVHFSLGRGVNRPDSAVLTVYLTHFAVYLALANESFQELYPSRNERYLHANILNVHATKESKIPFSNLGADL